MINRSDFPIIKKLIEKFGGKVNEGQLNSAIDAKVADGTIASGEQLDNKASNIWYYTPKEQEGYQASVLENLKAQNIYDLYDNLVANNSSYITKTLLGNDTSGETPIYKYEFKPSEPNCKIIIGANIHGNGDAGDSNVTAISIFNFFRELCNSYSTNDKLFYMRWKIHFVVIPVQNPWGFNNKKRQNVNGVDLNRNFDWKWQEYPVKTPWVDYDYKGTAPFSEKESQYIRDVLLSNRDAIAYIDYHSISGQTQTDYFNYVGVGGDVFNKISRNLAGYLSSVYNIGSTITSLDTFPSSYAYSDRVLGINSCNPELIVKSIAINDTYSSYQMTKALTWYSNFILGIISERENIKKSINSNAFARVYNNQSQQIGGTNTLLSWSNVQLNIGNMCDGIDNSKIKIKSTGYYEIAFNFPFVGSSLGVRQVYVRKNGSTPINTIRIVASPSGSTVVNGYLTERLTVGDYIEILAVQTSGETVNIVNDTPNGYLNYISVRQLYVV